MALKGLALKTFEGFRNHAGGEGGVGWTLTKILNFSG